VEAMKKLFVRRQIRNMGFILYFMFTLVSCNKADNIAVKNQPVVRNQGDERNSSEVTKLPQDTTATTDEAQSENVKAETKTYAESYKDTGVLPSLAEVYKDKFRIGVSLSKLDIENKDKAALVAGQFSSITCENEMKADFTLDREATLALEDENCPVVNMKNAETALNFAKENGLKMRAHTLVWHSQTPRWLFTVGYDNDPEAPLVTREVMLKRMENYIRQEMEYVNNNYQGVVYAWDVVNEAIEPGDGQENKIRTKDNLWYEVVGEDYIEWAFTYARKYAAPEQKLFYNDYGTYEKAKMFPICDLINKLKEKNIIDGIGMQDHISIDYPTILDYQYAINKYAELGIEIQITELDISMTGDSEEAQQKQATRYKLLMTILQNCMDKNNAKITSITLWGLTDDRSWLNKSDQPNYPLLFDKNLQPKPAYFGFLQDGSIKSY
jgi:GH35 family endo-1,4-beta-xylanase